MYCEANENPGLSIMPVYYVCTYHKSNDNHTKLQAKSFVYSTRGCHDCSQSRWSKGQSDVIVPGPLEKKRQRNAI